MLFLLEASIIHISKMIFLSAVALWESESGKAGLFCSPKGMRVEGMAAGGGPVTPLPSGMLKARCPLNTGEGAGLNSPVNLHSLTASLSLQEFPSLRLCSSS